MISAPDKKALKQIVQIVACCSSQTWVPETQRCWVQKHRYWVEGKLPELTLESALLCLAPSSDIGFPICKMEMLHGPYPKGCRGPRWVLIPQVPFIASPQGLDCYQLYNCVEFQSRTRGQQGRPDQRRLAEPMDSAEDFCL